MTDRNDESAISQVEASSSPWAFIGFLAVILLGCFTSGSNGDLNHGLILSGAGLLMLIFPPVARVPASWWILYLVFAGLSALSFLPADPASFPAWRQRLQEVGLDTGDLHVIQHRQAAEILLLHLMALGIGLWFCGQRASAASRGNLTLAFSLTVAGYAVAAKILNPDVGAQSGDFGFFPNRNHTATLLAMGALTGVASVIQSIRQRHAWRIGLAVLATSLCTFAILQWSISRSGFVLAFVGVVLWIPLVRKEVLGRHSAKAFGLIALAAAGMFFIVDTPLKLRLQDTHERIATASAEGWENENASGEESIQSVDFRIPTWLDTIDMIKAEPWSGVGPGQFSAIFPQFRHRASVANGSQSVHPESDWLWLAAEYGVPASLTILLLALAGFAFSLRNSTTGRGRAGRMGCLIAAALLSIHGIFDVPGHRVPLIWAAVFLYCLSLPSIGLRPRSPHLLRLLGLAPLFYGGWLLAHLESGSTLQAPSITRNEAVTLLKKDRLLWEQAEAAGEVYQPTADEDLIEQALLLTEKAQKTAPLDRPLLRLEALLAAQFDDKFEQLDRALAIERELNPRSVGAVLSQVEIVAPISPERASALFETAIQRAKRLDRLAPGTPWSEDRVDARIIELRKKFGIVENSQPNR